MKRYILGRLIRAVVSLFCVVSITILLLFFMIPRDKIFDKDPNVTKLSGKPEQLRIYKLVKMEELGYLDYVSQREFLKMNNLDSTKVKNGSKEVLKIVNEYKAKGYTAVETKSGHYYVYKEYTPGEILGRVFSHLIEVDTVNYVQDPDNPNIERKIFFGLDHNRRPAIMGSGTKHRYLLYFNGSFPFIHMNFLSLNFGVSHPTFSGRNPLEVISDSQGKLVKYKQTFPNGNVYDSALDLYSAEYKMTSKLDRMEKKKFDNNYVKCRSYHQAPSMIGTSLRFGWISVFLAYLIGIPVGIAMARRKGKLADKLGIIYINIMSSVPYLAMIFFVRAIAGFVSDLPDKFSQLGYANPKSYILPLILLTMVSVSGLMLWIRRYMIDQTSADYVKFAKAKGLTRREIFNRHIFKNAAIPLANGFPRAIMGAVVGAFYTETIFAVPGMGKMLPTSIEAGNNSVVIALVFIFTGLGVLSVILGDLFMAMIDPRIQLNSKGGTR